MSSFPFTHRFATTLLTLPLAGASASNSLEPKDTKTYFSAKVSPACVSFSSVLIGVLLDVHLRQCLLWIQRYIRCDRPRFAGQNAREWLLPHRPETAPPRSVTAASAPLLKALCLSLRQSSPFPYRRCSGRRRPHSYMVFTVATRHPFRRCPDGVYNTLTGQQVVVPHSSGSCGAGGAGARAA